MNYQHYQHHCSSFQHHQCHHRHYQSSRFNNKFFQELYLFYIFVVISTLFCNIAKSENEQQNLFHNNDNIKSLQLITDQQQQQQQQFKLFKKINKKKNLNNYLWECRQLWHSNHLSMDDLERACNHRNMWLKDAFNTSNSNNTFLLRNKLTGLWTKKNKKNILCIHSQINLKFFLLIVS